MSSTSPTLQGKKKGRIEEGGRKAREGSLEVGTFCTYSGKERYGAV